MQNRHKPQKPVSRAAISLSTIQKTGTDQSTGIYQQVIRNIGTAEEMGKYVKRLDVATTLGSIEKRALSILAEQGYDTWPVRIKTQKEFTMPDGTKRDFEGVKGIPGGNSILNDADEALLRIKYVRDSLSDGTPENAALNAFFLGLVTERMEVRAFEPLVLVGKEAAMLWRGHVVRVTDLERRILTTIIVADEVPLQNFVTYVWEESYNSERRDKYDQAIKRLNRTISDSGVPVQLHVRGDKVIVE